MFNSVPDKYFENLKSNILNRLDHLEDEIKVNAPTLSKVSKNEVYLIPDYYFQNLRLKIISQVSKTRVIRLGLTRSIAAACIALLLYFSSTQIFQSQESTVAFAENEILDFYIENADEIELNDLTDLSIKEQTGRTSLFEEFNEDELETYLTDIVDELAIEAIVENNI